MAFPTTVAIPRYAVRDTALPDGTKIPAGYKAAVDMKAIHFNPEVYPNPEVFDAFRFSKLRESEESNVKYGFTTLDNNVTIFVKFGSLSSLKCRFVLDAISFCHSVQAGTLGEYFYTHEIPDSEAHLSTSPGRFFAAVSYYDLRT